MLIIYRRPLADKGERSEIARYSDVSLHTGNKFIETAAQKEAENRKDVKHLAVRDVESDGKITHTVTLIGHHYQSLTEFFGVWT